MIIVWLTLAVALVVHEGSHYLLLRLAGLDPKPSFHFPGLGWKFHTQGATSRQLVDIWLVGPIMEALVWAGSALLFPTWAWELLLVMVVEMATNLLLPGSDGRRALRLLRPGPTISTITGLSPEACETGAGAAVSDAPQERFAER
ncbi:MAG: hypothetical protein M0027_10365 [Candidatus Dormibacteraeota bacterium]|jgi:hypothetical protein|nr:hypothetical protein [Candidatus Dormibacteraeota bacterium]